MGLRVVYRSYGGENTKSRPGYYSKSLMLASFLRAVDKVSADVVFMNDGPIPDDRRTLMEARGGVVQLPGVGMRRSYVAGLRLPLRRGWADEDLVWFSEDDYLYTPDAFGHLVSAADQIPEAHYFALYGSTPARPVYPRAEHEASYPRGWRPLPPFRIDDHDWVNIVSTASTFGARVGALRQDLSIFLQCMLPHRHRFRDHETCVIYQGYQPFDWWRTMAALSLRGPGSFSGRTKNAAMAPFELAMNARARRRPRNRRLLVAADPNLAAHMEVEHLPPGTDWAAVATETTEWAGARGIALPTTTAPAAQPHGK